MPTGYTASVADGTITTFPDFAMRCARAMGACIMMRDEPGDAEIPEKFKPSQWNREQGDIARIALAVHCTATNEELQTVLDQEHDKAMEAWRLRVVEHAAEQTRYEDMIRDTKAWTPPTDEHAGLKKFMLQQLWDSLKSDCGGSVSPAPDKLPLDDWKAAREAKVREDIIYHDKNQAEEDERSQGRTEWVRQLRASLK